MPTLTLWIAPPDQWAEVFFADESSNVQRIAVDAKLAPFRTKVIPEQPGWDAIRIDFVSSSTKQNPTIGCDRHNGTYAWIPVDFSALGWIKEQWGKGRQIEVQLDGEEAEGFTFGFSPDGDDVVWDQDRAKRLKMNQVVLSVSAYREGTELQTSEAPLPLPPIHPDLKKLLARIAGRIDILVAFVAIAAVYFWSRR